MTINDFSSLWQASVSFVKTLLPRAVPRRRGRRERATAWTNGTGALQINQWWETISATAAAATPVTIDITGGITDDYGDTLTATKAKIIRIENNGATNSLTYTLTGFGPTGIADVAAITLQPGESHTYECPTSAGWAVTSGDEIVVTSASGTTYSVYLGLCV